jgi:thiol-disulfide isomerase/thioredoxin
VVSVVVTVPGYSRQMSAARRSRALLLAACALLAAAPSAIEVLGRDGEPVRLALEPDESALVVHFWASWCADCKTELPALARAARACEGTAVRVVTVNAGESPETIARFEAQQAIALPVLRDPDGKAWRRFARGLPANLVWTASGRRSEVGPYDEEAWQRKLAALGCRSSNASP